MVRARDPRAVCAECGDAIIAHADCWRLEHSYCAECASGEKAKGNTRLCATCGDPFAPADDPPSRRMSCKECATSRSQCNICDDCSWSRYVCAACRADPANADWKVPSRLERLANDAPEQSERRGGIRDLDKPPRARSAKFAVVAWLVLVGVEDVKVRYRDRRGRSRGFRKVSKECAQKKIARLANCSQGYVSKVKKLLSTEDSGYWFEQTDTTPQHQQQRARLTALLQQKIPPDVRARLLAGNPSVGVRRFISDES